MHEALEASEPVQEEIRSLEDKRQEHARLVNVRDELKHLRALSDKAEDGDREARGELRAAVQRATPEIVARCADAARTYRRMLAKTASGEDPLVEDAIVEQASHMAREMAGENPSHLEVLLAERIASLWVLTELQEALLSAYYGRTNLNVSPTYLLQMGKLQESVNRRYLAAIKTLAQVRKLQANTPAVAYNTQINIRQPTRVTRTSKGRRTPGKGWGRPSPKKLDARITLSLYLGDKSRMNLHMGDLESLAEDLLW